MVEIVHPVCETHLVRIEPDDRIVVLARTLQTRAPEAESVLRDNALDWARFGPLCLGQALYRHRYVFRSAANAPTWSHLELSYFRGIVPTEVILDLVARWQPAGMHLLRAEILLTTPSSFVLPRGWRGAAGRPASLEYIDVGWQHLGTYRDVMRRYCGPAAARLVEANRFGTFRAMETAAVLRHDPAFGSRWNQIHLCEVDPDGFAGFGREFADTLRDTPDGAAVPDVFAGLDRIRTVPRWTFNEPVVEADAVLGREGSLEI